MNTVRSWVVWSAAMASGCGAFGAASSEPSDAGVPSDAAQTFDAGVFDAARATDANGASDSSRSEVGLVLALDFDHDTDTKAFDSSGQGNDGTVVASARAVGVTGQALEFHGKINDSTTSKVQIPNSASLDITGSELTIAFWMNIPSLPTSDQVLVSKGWQENSMAFPFYQFGVELNAGSKEVQLFIGATNFGDPVIAVAAPTPGTWAHVAFTLHGGTSTVFLNGEMKDTKSGPSITRRGTPLQLGVDADGSQPFVGKLDGVRIYNRALSAPEVQQLAKP
jgi:hypothetical protein